jgi:protein-disulfide isomerase
MMLAATTEPAAAAVAGFDHIQGDPHAHVTLLEYGDYQCPACIRAEPFAQRLVESGGRHLQFVFRHYPLMELHPMAELAAEASEAAAAQGKFWPMHHLIFNQTHHLTLASLTACAESLELDMNRFKAEMADRIYTQRVQEHCRAGEYDGVKSTPAFFLNGKPVDVVRGFGMLEATLHSLLKVR